MEVAKCSSPFPDGEPGANQLSSRNTGRELFASELERQISGIVHGQLDHIVVSELMFPCSTTFWTNLICPSQGAKTVRSYEPSILAFKNSESFSIKHQVSILFAHHVSLAFASRAGGTTCHLVILEAVLLRYYNAHPLGRQDQGPVYHNSSSKSIVESEDHHHHGF